MRRNRPSWRSAWPSSIARNGRPDILLDDIHPDGTTAGLYADLSRYYDAFCAQVDYVDQCAFAHRLFEALGESDGLELLDLACGTGQHLAIMAERGYRVSGLDNSPAMLEAAARRCPSATLIPADLASFELPPVYDLITCFLYSILYSHPVATLQRTLALVFKALRPGGLLIFDLADKAGVAQRDAVSRSVLDGARFEFRSGWRYQGAGEALELRVSIKRLPEPSLGIAAAQWHDSHTMTATSISDVHAIMQTIGFETFILERDFNALKAWSGQSSNVVFAGRRPCQ